MIPGKSWAFSRRTCSSTTSSRARMRSLRVTAIVVRGAVKNLAWLGCQIAKRFTKTIKLALVGRRRSTTNTAQPNSQLHQIQRGLSTFCWSPRANRHFVPALSGISPIIATIFKRRIVNGSKQNRAETWQRVDRWSESIAVGSEGIVEQVKK
jgi:hypothetical protein